MLVFCIEYVRFTEGDWPEIPSYKFTKAGDDLSLGPSFEL